MTQEHFDSDESAVVSNKGLALLGGDETVTQIRRSAREARGHGRGHAGSKLCEHVKQEHFEHFDSDESVAVSNKGLALLGGDETVTHASPRPA